MVNKITQKNKDLMIEKNLNINNMDIVVKEFYHLYPTINKTNPTLFNDKYDTVSLLFNAFIKEYYRNIESKLIIGKGLNVKHMSWIRNKDLTIRLCESYRLNDIEHTVINVKDIIYDLCPKWIYLGNKISCSVEEFSRRWILVEDLNLDAYSLLWHKGQLNNIKC